MQLEAIVDSLQILYVATPLNLPVAVPDARVSLGDPRDAGSGAIGTLGVIETLAVEVAQSEMGEVEIADVPSGILNGISGDGLAEKSEFESEAMAVGGLEIARVIPPLGLKIRMTEMIAGKFETIAGKRCVVLPRQRLREEESYEEANELIPHE